MANSEWVEIMLDDLIDVKHGYAFRGEFFSEAPTENILLTPGNFAIGGGFKADKFKYYSGDVPTDYILSGGDIVITMTDLSKAGDTLGFPALIPAHTSNFYLHNQRLGKVIIKDDSLVDSGFLYYLLCTAPYRHEVVAGATGSTVKHTSPGRIKKYRTFIPSDINEQRRIAHTLGGLDDKIELNRQLNGTLQQLVRTLFQSWFVDFDPVRAKISGEPEESICRRLGLTPELLALFPAAVQSSAMGEIPAGWRVTSIGEAVDVVGGGTPSTAIEEYWQKGTYHWATPKDLSGLNSPILLDTDKKITEKGVRNISSGLLPRDTVLLSSRAPVGYLAISAVPIAINQGFIAMRCNGPITPYYAYMWCLENMGAIKSRASGTTFLEISKKSFRPMPVLVPDKQIMLEFTALVELLFNQIEEGAKESVTLASLRDELLPKLLSGQIKLS